MSTEELESAFPAVGWPQNYALQRTASWIRQIEINVTESRP
jgi:hypothetical protein